ncbi:MAG: hypothetical protein J0M35_20450 [Candidatus Obscuribacter phosphatis]|uniref:Uncharacterized protein n=1 Tax=Candidatus Obscuribacter phosphatis TaxID=1906157 RepID=A0A8J7TP51_9BACT|nr:hypothetical protein [Candidatus Obscuribacter phosphatis]
MKQSRYEFEKLTTRWKLFFSVLIVMVMGWTNTLLHDMADSPAKQTAFRYETAITAHTHSPTIKQNSGDSMLTTVQDISAVGLILLSYIDWASTTYQSQSDKFIAFAPGEGAIFANSPPIFLVHCSFLI